jgi:O-antigen ligase
MIATASKKTMHNSATDGARMLAALGAIVSFESVFVLFIFSGQYKADPRFEWLPMDATILFGLINVSQAILLCCDRRFRFNRIGMPIVLAGVLFACYSLMSTTWCEGVRYATYKSAYIATINMWCLFAGAMVISASAQRLVRFLSVLVVFSSWIAAECLLYYVSQARFGHVMQIDAMANEGAYIGLGRVVMTGALVCAIVWLFAGRREWGLWKSRNISFAALVFLSISGAMIGARGPMAAAVLTLIFLGMKYSEPTVRNAFSKNVGRLIAVSIVGSIAIYLYKLKTGNLPLLVLRFLAFDSNSEYYDTSGQSLMRLELFSEAVRGWLERPLFGHGIGGFPLIWGSNDERLFPHNLVLELLCELGLVGLVLFALIPIAAIRLNRLGWRQTPVFYKAIAIGLPAYAFANTMTSGDLPDNRFLFLALGLLAFRDFLPPLKSQTKSQNQPPSDRVSQRYRTGSFSTRPSKTP